MAACRMNCSCAVVFLHRWNHSIEPQQMTWPIPWSAHHFVSSFAVSTLLPRGIRPQGTHVENSRRRYAGQMKLLANRNKLTARCSSLHSSIREPINTCALLGCFSLLNERCWSNRTDARGVSPHKTEQNALNLKSRFKEGNNNFIQLALRKDPICKAKMDWEAPLFVGHA